MTRFEAHAKYRQALNLGQREGCRQDTVRYLSNKNPIESMFRGRDQEDLEALGLLTCISVREQHRPGDTYHLTG